MIRVLGGFVLAMAVLPSAAAEIPAAARAAVEMAKNSAQNLAEAEKWFRRALAELPGDAHRRDRQTIEIELADIEVARGRYGEAIARNEAVVREAREAGDLEIHARALDRQGYAYRELGDFAMSLEKHKLSRQVAAAIADAYARGNATARALNLIGAVEARMAEEANWQYDEGRARLGFQQAVQDLEAAIAAAEPLVPLEAGRAWNLQEFLEVTPKTRLSWIGGTMSNAQLSLFELRLQNIDYRSQAEQSSRRAVERAAAGSEPRASALHFYARVLARQKRFDEALAALDEAEAIWLKTQPPSYRMGYGYQVRAGEVYLQMQGKRIEAALEYYAKARALYLRSARCNDVATMDYLAGRTLEQLERKDEAKRMYMASIEIYERLRAELSPKERLEFFATRLRPYEALIRLLHESWRSTGNPADAELAFAYSERSRARSLLDTMEAAQRVAAPKPVAPGARDACEPTNLPRPDEKRAAQFSGLTVARFITVDKVASVMRAGDVLVEYFIGDSASYAFVIARGRLDMVPLPITKRGLVVRMRELNLPIKEAVEKNRYEPLLKYDLVKSYRLYRDLVGPIEPQIPRDGRLIVVPHRTLFYLPLEALVAEPKGARPEQPTYGDFQEVRYFLDRAPAIRYALSASVLYLMENQKDAGDTEGKVLAILNPPTGDRGLPQLTAFEQMWPALNSEFRGVVDGRGSRGTKELFFQESGSSALVILGVHGVLQDDAPLKSRMLLAGGDLTAQEILNRVDEGKRIPARLFTLAACQLGSGQLREGEGIVGMTRILQSAGTQRIVAALWHVDVKPTANLVVAIHHQIAKQATPRGEAALRAAKLSMRNSKDTPKNIPVPFAHPFFWGAFVIY